MHGFVYNHSWLGVLILILRSKNPLARLHNSFTLVLLDVGPRARFENVKLGFPPRPPAPMYNENFKSAPAADNETFLELRASPQSTRAS